MMNIRISVLPTLVFIILPLSTPGWADQIPGPTNQPISFEIKAQPLGDALNLLAQQSGMQIVFYSEVAGDLESKLMIGDFSSEQEALDFLLRDTGLTYKYINDRTVAIQTESAGEEQESGKSRPAPRQILVAQAGTSAQPSQTVVTSSTDRGGVINEDGKNVKAAVLEEVVVTATKTGETLLQQTPVTITAITEQDLNDRNIFTLSDLTAYVPNTAFTYWGTGKMAGYIRGIGAANMNWGEDARVGYYIDGVFIDRGIAANSTFFDVERMEVLRGPQGTLYGRNTTGGALNIITKKPSDELDAEIGIEVGNYNKSRVDATISGPLVEDMKGRMSLSRSSHDGYLNNLSGLDIFDEDYTGVRGAIEWTPTDKVDVMMRADYYNSDARAWQNRLMTDTGLPAARAAAAGIPKSTYLPDDFWTVSKDFDSLNTLETWGVSGQVDFQLSDNMSIRSITAYRETSQHVEQDFDSTGLALAHAVSFNDFRQFTQELQLDGNLDRWQWLVGFFYFHSEEEKDGFNEYGFVMPDLKQMFDSTNGAESWAVFGNVTFALTDQLSIEGGLRYTYEEKSGAYEQWGDPVFPPFDNSLPSDSKDWDDLSGKIGLNYQLNDEAIMYVLASRAFKSGYMVPTNFATNIWVDPETLWDYEIGFKTDWFDNRLRVNGAFFYYDYTDMQVRTFVVLGTSTAGQVENAAEATIKGVELEITARPISPLTLSGSISYLDAKYDTFIAAVGNTGVDVSGNPLAITPNWKLVFGGQYKIPIQDYGFLTLSGNLTWTDKQYFDHFKNPLMGQEAYTLVDAFARFETRDQHWSFEIYGKNLAEEEYITNSIEFIGDIIGTIGAPRTFGFQAVYKY